MIAVTSYPTPALELDLEIDPIPKDRPRFGNGRTYATPRQRMFEQTFRALCLQAGWRKPLEGLLLVAYEFHIPHKRLTDIDNLCKQVSDAGQGDEVGALWRNDRQIRGYRWVYAYDGAAQGRISVKAWEI